MTEFFSNPLNTFLVGLGVAVVLAGYVWFKGVLNRRDLRRELQGLKEQLHRQMTIVDKGNEKTLAEVPHDPWRNPAPYRAGQEPGLN